MKNFPVKVNNKEYWISRAIAVVVFLYAKDDFGKTYILANKRGKGTPDPEFIGSYCVPCGYLDYNETILQAAMRELKEETGLVVPDSLFTLAGINDNPKDDKRQNVTFRYIVKSDSPIEELQKDLTAKYSENNEVSDIKFIPLDEIDTYKWAFNHDKLIKQYLFSNNDTFNIRYRLI